MPKKTVRIGSRKSRLAVIQTDFVARLLRKSHPELEIETVVMDTTGDLLRDRPLAAVGGKGLFTLELEQALRRGEIDLSVHSLKDLPEELPADLPILAYSRREDPRDALVLPEGTAYRGLGPLIGAKPVGSSSPRRTAQLLTLCPGLPVAPVGECPHADPENGKRGLRRTGSRGRRSPEAWPCGKNLASVFGGGDPPGRRAGDSCRAGSA